LNNIAPDSNERTSLASRIIYQDENCIVVNKIAGEAVEGAGKGMTDLSMELAEFLVKNNINSPAAGTFPDGITQHIENSPQSGITLTDKKSRLTKNNLWPWAVHRLDVPVTGCTLFACNSHSLAFLNSSFDLNSKSRIEKRYWAVVEKTQAGKIANEGKLEHWIEYNGKKNKAYVFSEEAPRRRKAIMNYRIVGEGDNYLFAEIDLITGRRHQIRAQLAQAGMCVKGDLKYGAKRSEKNGGIRLHAHRLIFPDTADKNIQIIVTAMPPVMDNLWEAFKNCLQNC